MPASPPTNVIHVVMHDVRADIDTPALSALRSDGATYGAGVAVVVLGPLCGLGCFCCGAWLYLRTRGEARRARRHERMLEREHLQESPSGRPHEELGTEL
jgi:hypothetical protein